MLGDFLCLRPGTSYIYTWWLLLFTPRHFLFLHRETPCHIFTNPIHCGTLPFVCLFKNLNVGSCFLLCLREPKKYQSNILIISQTGETSKIPRLSAQKYPTGNVHFSAVFFVAARGSFVSDFLFKPRVVLLRVQFEQANL